MHYEQIDVYICIVIRIYLCRKYLYDAEGGRGSTDTLFDKVLSIRDGKVDPLLHRMHVGLPFIARSAARFSKYRAAKIRSRQLTFTDDIY